jgi:antitoxin HigA-1
MNIASSRTQGNKTADLAERQATSRRRRAAKENEPALSSISPGEILLEEFLVPLGVSQNGLARAIEVPPARINDIVHNRRAITADSAVRLGIYFGTSVEFWINLQAQYDARVARSNDEPALRRRIKPFAAA